MTWPEDHKSAWVALALDDVAMTLATKSRAPNAQFDRILPSLDLGDITHTSKKRDFKSQLQDEFDNFLDHIADREPDLEPEVMDWLITQWASLEDSPLSFRSRGGRLVVVASRDIPSRTHIKGLEDIVMLVGDEAAIEAEVTTHYIEWIKVEKKDQPFVWCGPFRLALRGCSLCSNTQWKKLKPMKGFPKHTVRQVLAATKPIKKGDVISCNFGIPETRQCHCEDANKKDPRQTWASGGPGIPSIPSPEPSEFEERSSRSSKPKPKSRDVTPASCTPDYDPGATEMVLSLCAELDRPSTPHNQITPPATDKARSSSPAMKWSPAEINSPPKENDCPVDDSERPAVDDEKELPTSPNGYSTQEEGASMVHEARPAKRKAADDHTTSWPSAGRKMRMSTGGRMPRPAPSLESWPKKTSVDPTQNPVALLTPPYGASTVSGSSDAGGDNMNETHQAESRVAASSSNGPINHVIIRLPPMHRRLATVDAGVNTVPRPATCEAARQHSRAGGNSQDVEMSEAPATPAAAIAAAEALLARILELETRNHSLLAANRKLLQRDHPAESNGLAADNHRAWHAPEIPFGLMLARKYREEGPWRRKCFELIGAWVEENRQLQDTAGQLRESNAQLVTENAQLMGQNARLRQELERQQKANQEGSDVLAAERDEIRQLIADNQHLRNLFNAQRDRILALGSPHAQFVVGGANQQAPVVFRADPQHRRATPRGTNPRSRTSSVTNTPHVRPATPAITQATQQPRPSAAATSARAPKAARRAVSVPSPRHEVFQTLSLPLQQSLLRDCVAQQTPHLLLSCRHGRPQLRPQPAPQTRPSSPPSRPTVAQTQLRGLPSRLAVNAYCTTWNF